MCKDLFPNTILNESEKGDFETKMEKEIETQNLQATPYFTLKVEQLFQTLVVRHGVMLVGQTLAGKTKSLDVLENVLGDVSKYTINPKSITSA